MLTREQFVTQMKEICAINAEYRKVTDALHNAGITIELPQFESIYDIAVDTLSMAMNDNCGNVGYFVYDLDFGNQEIAKRCIRYSDGRVYSLTTIDELYDYLVIAEHETMLPERKYKYEW